MAKTSMRLQVAELIEEGKYTKVEIAEKLETKVASVSSNMTYIRWGGKFIIWNADKVLSFTDEAGFDEWEAERKAGSKSSKAVSKLSPQEQLDKYSKTIANQEKSLVKWETKVEEYEEKAPKDDTLLPEAEANVILIGIKLLRNKAKLAAVDTSDLADTDGSEVEEVEEAEELL
jgi:hypothetical protein